MYRRKNLKNTQILQAALHCYQPLHCRMKGRFDKLCNNTASATATATASWCCLLATHHPESMQSSFRVEHFHMFSHVAAFDCFDSGCCWLGLIDDKSLLLTTHPSFQKYHWQHLINCPKMNEYQNNILKKVICSPFFFFAVQSNPLPRYSEYNWVNIYFRNWSRWFFELEIW